MKTITSAILASFISVAAHAQNSVPSVNAAGYIKVSVEEGKFYFLQNPFNTFDGSQQTLDGVVGTALPDGSTIYLWNATTQTFDLSNYIEGVGWLPNLPVSRGSGFFVQPTAGANPTSNLFLFGEVPGATTAQTTQLLLQPGFNSIGFPYPVGTTLGTSGLNAATQEPDSVYMWNATSQGYEVFNRLDIPGLEWGGAESTPIPPGAALFVNKSQQTSFNATVPYSWPNN